MPITKGCKEGSSRMIKIYQLERASISKGGVKIQGVYIGAKQFGKSAQLTSNKPQTHTATRSRRALHKP